jgi:hypothetical protein
MREDTRTRAAAVAVLVTVGAAMGVGGAALGVGGPVADDPAAEFVVSGDGVAVGGGDQQPTVVADNVTTEAVQIERRGTNVVVSTVSAGALTDEQRERAKQVARGNETVAAHLDGVDEYSLAVEPIPVLNASHTTAVSVEDADFEVQADGNDSTVETFETDLTVEESDGESVRLGRDGTYADDQAVVVVQQPGTDDRSYVVHVDLANQTVARIVDRR